MLHFIIGKAGCGKTHEIFRLIQSLPAEQEAFVLVPEQASFEYEKQMLSLPPKKRREVFSFTRLCDRALKTYGGIAGTPLTNEEKILLMARAVGEVKPALTVYRKQAGYPEFYTHLLALISECRFGGVTPDSLEQAAPMVGIASLSRKLTEIALIWRAYEGLVNASYIDPETRLHTVAALLEDKDFFKGKVVFVDAFKGFTAPQKELLKLILRQAEEVYLTLCADGDHPSAQFHLFENQKAVKREWEGMVKSHRIHGIYLENHRTQSQALITMERILAGEEFEYPEETEDIEIYACQNNYDQAETVATLICDLVQNKGYCYRDIALITRNLSSVQDTLERAFSRYGIPFHSDRRTPFATGPLAAFTKRAVTLAQKGFTTETLISLMQSTLTSLTQEEIAHLVNYSVTWSVQGADWLESFTKHPLNKGEPDPALTAQINQARLRLISPLLALKQAFSKGAVCKDYAAAVYVYLQSAEIFKNLEALYHKTEQKGDPIAMEELTRSPSLLISLLDRMIRALGDTPLSGEEFVKYFTLCLSATDMGSLPQGVNQVLIGDAAHTRWGNPKVMIVMGANAGNFPAVPPSGGLFSDRDRRILSQNNLCLSDHGQFDTVEESFLFYQTACAPSQKVIFTYLTANNATVCSPLSKVMVQIPACRKSTSRQVQETFPAPALVPALEYFTAHYRDPSPFARALSAYVAKEYPHLYQTAKALTSPVDCSLEPRVATRLFGETIKTSPTALETYSKCRFLYLCEKGLGLEPLQPVKIDSLARGKIVHYVLEQVVKAYPGKALSQLPEQDLKALIAQHTEAFVNKEMGGFAKQPATFAFQVERVNSLLFFLLTYMAGEMAQSKFVPTYFEYRFDDKPHNGQPPRHPPYQIPLDKGKLLLRGSVDRVDLYEDKQSKETYLRVVDYKTGSQPFHLEDLYHGMNLQMFNYLMMLEEALHYRRAGVLYMPARRDAISDSEKNQPGKLQSNLRMKGMVVNTPQVVQAMDPLASGQYLPVKQKTNKQGELEISGSVADDHFFTEVFACIKDLFTQMGNNLHQGNITCEPLDGRDSNADSCKYCNVKAACPLGAEQKNAKVEPLEKEQKEALLKGGNPHGN